MGDTRSMKEYIADHLKLRNQMIASQYPLILDESTTMEFITQGLSSHALYEGVHDHFLLNGYPETVETLSQNLQKLEASRKNTQEKVMNTASPVKQERRPFQYQNRGRGRYRKRSRWHERRPNYNSNQDPSLTMDQFTTLLNAL